MEPPQPPPALPEQQPDPLAPRAPEPIPPSSEPAAWTEPASAPPPPPPTDPFAPPPPPPPDPFAPPAQAAGAMPAGAIPAGYVPPPGGTPPPPTPDLMWVPPKRPLRRRILGRVVPIAAVVVVGIAYFAFKQFTSTDGQILFTLSTPPAEGCDVSNATKTVSTSDKVYFVAVLRHHNNGTSPLKLVVTTPEGLTFSDKQEGKNQEFDCVSSSEALGPLDAGDYKFKVTTVDGSTEAEGTLTVK